ncbi:hypothetical protein MRQ47_004475 [Salmonella enterica]|nr:hypothetical protein [Salmonella enterica]
MKQPESMRFSHLKELGSQQNSPLLLIALVAGGDYADALEIMARQGCPAAKQTQTMITGLEQTPEDVIERELYITIGDYLAGTGGAGFIREFQADIVRGIAELRRRRNPPDFTLAKLEIVK